MSLLRHFSYFLVAFLIAGSASAATIIPKDQADQGVVNLSVPYLEDQTQSNSAIQAAVEFNRLQQANQLTSTSKINFSTKGGIYWIALNLTNNSNDTEWWFNLAPTVANQISPIKSLTLYDPADPMQKPLASWPENARNAHMPSVPLQLKQGETVSRYVLVQTWSGVDTSLMPQLRTQSYLDQLSTSMAQKSGLLWLIMGAVFGIGMVQLLLTRQTVQGFLALNALLIGAGVFLTDRSDLIPNINSVHPVLLPLSIAAVYGIGASLMLWIAARPYSPKASMCFLPMIVNGIVLALTLFSMDKLVSYSIPIELLPEYLLTLTGLALFGLTIVFGLGHVSLYWFVPPWLALMALPWLSADYPYASAITYVLLLGVAGIASVFWHWKAMGDETESLQKRLRQELRNFKDKFQEEDANWQKKMETQRALLNELRMVEQQRSAELEIAKKEADLANKAKSDFLAIISHEIRTPMNGIMGIVQLLDESRMEEKQREYIDVIKNSGDTMLTLLNDILDYSKIEKGAIDLESIPFSLRKLVNSVATLMSGRAKDKGISINVEVAEGLPEMLQGDPGRVRQILLNLASNAVKFTEKGGVTIRVTQSESSMLRFEVVDTGIGISEESQAKLFQAYVQADASIARRFGGTGLGLNICRMLVTAMNGSIGASSVEGTGSTFWFEIPLRQATVQAVDNKKESDAKYAAPKKLHALVIDDNEINLKIVCSLLEMDGHNVVTTTHAEKALQMVEQDSFDVIFVDIMMPGMDGTTFLKKLRQNSNPQRAAVPVFALTGMVDPASVQNMLASGIMDVIGKPVTKAALRDAVQKVVGKSAPIDVHSSVDDIISNMQNLSDKDKQKLLEALGVNQSSAPTGDGPNLTLLNMTILGELKTSLPQETLEEIFVDLIAKSKELSLHMAEAEHDKDFEDVGAKAHNLRGMAGNFGLQGLMEHAAKIEQAIRSNDNEKAALLVKENRLVLDQSLSALEHWLKS